MPATEPLCPLADRCRPLHPCAPASVVPAERLLSPGGVRWTLCATDRCFKSALLAPFFRAAKVGP